ncbi:hypothetical protein [Desulfobacter postgatei]|uniref:Uncharacterized protein n=1 Tax=Desulfobacter postgatei 2ac9 TaxID=879212 RepID=I5B161_9BACT|nr:hypothetical protein [Desulfobacter postgatei]EIM63224.1 hypothetical protein DespoDRAFT_01264 [Desulfobacter postgatei 2ac9]
MRYVYLTLNWVFGAIFLLTGGLAFVESPLAGLCMFTIAALLLPPIRKFVYSKTNKEISGMTRAISIFVLFSVFGLFMDQASDRREQKLAAQQVLKKAEKAVQLQQENVDYFNSNRETIISSIKKALAENDHQAVISQSKKYLVSGDKELEQLNVQAKTEKLLTELKSIPVKEYEKNRKLYRQLLEMNPDNEQYKDKVAFYAGKIEEEKQKQIAAQERQKKIETQFSAWNGSHINLERVIKDSMNDPKSYKHVETLYWDRGDHLIIRTTFRGKNAFGAVVKNSVKAKVSLYGGQVLQILDQ